MKDSTDIKRLIYNAQYIVTHPRDAHRDDVLSVAYAIPFFKIQPTILRTEPTEEMLMSPKYLVLDTGRRHEPFRLNFDHHQREESDAPECAFSLFVTAVGERPAFDLLHWFHHTILHDVMGPNKAMAARGSVFVPGLQSPIEGVVHALMEREREIIPGTHLYWLLETIGEQLHKKTVGLVERMEHLKSFVLKGMVVDETEMKGFDVVYLRETDTHMLLNYCGKHFPTCRLTIAYYYDEDKDMQGNIFKKIGEYDFLNLYKMKDHPLCDYAAKGGFMFKTNRVLGLKESLELLSSITDWDKIPAR